MDENIPAGYDNEGNRLPVSRYADADEIVRGSTARLAELSNLPFFIFLHVAEQIEVVDENWTEFWNAIAIQRGSSNKLSL